MYIDCSTTALCHTAYMHALKLDSQIHESKPTIHYYFLLLRTFQDYAEISLGFCLDFVIFCWDFTFCLRFCLDSTEIMLWFYWDSLVILLRSSRLSCGLTLKKTNTKTICKNTRKKFQVELSLVEKCKSVEGNSRLKWQ